MRAPRGAALAALLVGASPAGCSMDAAAEIKRLTDLVHQRERAVGGAVAAAPPPPPAVADSEETRSPLQREAQNTQQQQVHGGAAKGEAVTNADLGWDTLEKILIPGDGPKSAAGPKSLNKAGQGVGVQVRKALGTLEGMQPGTPPTMQELDDLAEAARAEQRFLCETWPDNDDCVLLTGQGNTRGPFTTLGKSAEDPTERMLAWKIVLRDEALVISVLGSSSSAGHDAFFNASYPVTMMRRLRPLFARIGIEQDTRNQAMGGWDYRMGTMWCIPQIAGFDPDIVTWEWSMFGPDACTMETYRRAVHALPRRPSVVWAVINGPTSGGYFWGELYYWACKGRGGAEAKAVCEAIAQDSGKIPANRRGDGDSALPCGAQEAWENIIRDHQCFEEYQVEQGRRRQSDPIYVKAVDMRFKSQGRRRPKQPHQWDVWAPSGWSKQLDEHYSPSGLGSYHQSTHGAVNRDWQPWWLYRHPVFRQSHHPGTFGHVMIGHQFAHWMLSRLLAAVEMVRKELQGMGGMDELADSYRKAREEYRAKPLPSPVFCSRPGLEDGGGSRHLCFTNFRPRRNLSSSIDSIVVDAGGWNIGLWDTTQKDDGKSYRDHKLITDSGVSDQPGTLKLRFVAPPGERDVDVGLCLYGKYVPHQSGYAKCNGEEVSVRLGAELRGMRAVAAPPLPVPSTGTPFKNMPSPTAGQNGVPNANRNPCRLACTVKPGATVDLHLRAAPGKQLVITHVIAV
eukprot:TRINITY_DN7961_c0_g1_i1.p1 TRINITY_DN7961_c0_g1~~TRINITY_DN7961_c0_g1_i1.p1  ORF type:complete len:736 (+),score=148.35 TRINITY_DN7961_c0_g1_i1:75-2282(+)